MENACLVDGVGLSKGGLMLQIQLNAMRVLGAAILVLGLIPITTNATLLDPFKNASLTLSRAEKDGSSTYWQIFKGTSDPYAAISWPVQDMGTLQGTASVYDYKHLGGKLYLPAVPAGWPKYQPSGWPNPHPHYSTFGQVRSESMDIIQLPGGSGIGTYLWEVGFSGAMNAPSQSDPYWDGSVSIAVNLTNDDGYNQTRSIVLHQADCPGGICSGILSAYFTGVPLGDLLNLGFKMYVNGALEPGSPALNIDMLSTATLLLQNITDASGQSVDVSLLTSESGTDYTTLPGEGNGQIPEPTTLALMSLGLVGIGFSRKKKQS